MGQKLGKNTFSLDLGKNAGSKTALVESQRFLSRKGALASGRSGRKHSKNFVVDQKAAEQLDSHLLFKDILLAKVNNEFTKVGQLSQQGVEQFPTEARFYLYLAISFSQSGNYLEALKHLTQGLALEPQNSEILVTIGDALEGWGKPHDAKGFYQAALAVDPANVPAISNLFNLSLAESDWSFFPKLPDMLKVLEQANTLGNPFNILSLTDAPGLHKSHLMHRDRSMQKNVLKNDKFKPQVPPGEKIRIGYFSSDFHNHATMFLLGKFFENHDLDRFEVFLYDLQALVDTDFGRQIRSNAQSYVSLVGMTDKQAAERARADGLDIAVDMKGYTKGSRPLIFSQRVAPTQVSYLGYPGTSGISNMDYFVGDPVTVPAKNRRFFNEKIIYMPNCYQANDNLRPHPDVIPSKAELGLPEDKFIFCSLNNPNKVTPVEYDIWMRLLHTVPDSVLWILAPSEHQKKNLTDEAAARGIGPERLVFAGRLSIKAHLARLPQADLFLDTFNCCAHTTASETLWSGVPLITKPGEQFASRVAASLLTAIGCEDLITQSAEDYFDLALKLAQDPDALGQIKQRLKDNLWTTPLYDSESYLRDFQDLMEKAVTRQRSGQAPKHLFLGEEPTSPKKKAR